jgi:hypothetical protein
MVVTWAELGSGHVLLPLGWAIFGVLPHFFARARARERESVCGKEDSGFLTRDWHGSGRDGCGLAALVESRR